ncbi:stage V sporulation protein K [Thermovenabulum gondwanense]|uniref:Stage V sporulation protein K n=1 Tax=Thermovenabulum gondwanense TaxID=520767 RepID=A0A162M7H4_9FIRM|nr:stage V sporulation protein K [Thermovenabulum gondwanense]KYO64461.1 Stage V sporulation protein K [Thermovenabulum gondwanense]
MLEIKNPIYKDCNDILNMVSNGSLSPLDALSLLKEMEIKKNELKRNKEEKVKEVLNELDSLVGLTAVKQLVKELHAFVEIQKRRKKEDLIAEPLVLHMIFKGSPGTGKTTVARLIGKMFKEMEILQKGHLVEVERADLVGEYIGHTAQKTREQIKKAIGGILFIDEAYSLARGGEKDFGKEAIDTLVKAMEDYKDNLIVILAGYKDEMDWFLRTNPGLRSRFPIQIEFPDYTLEELIQIAILMAEKRQYKFTPEAIEKLKYILLDSKKSIYFDKLGNARLVRNLLEKAIRKQALRLINQKKISKEDLILIKPEDILPLEDY